MCVGARGTSLASTSERSTCVCSAFWEFRKFLDLGGLALRLEAINGLLVPGLVLLRLSQKFLCVRERERGGGARGLE